jgi:iron complex outermembrane receptor protein
MKKLFSLVTLIAFTALPTATFAQDSELVLEEVVVTATKREENVQDIAQTVNAVTGAQLDNYQIRDLSELAQLVSGVQFTKIDPRRQQITMRGQKLDPDGGNDSPIQGYVDEIPLRTGEVFLQMYDTERVEILKGAQGTLQGAVSSGGALHIYTRSAQVGSGERNGYVKTTWADNMTSIVEAASDMHLSDTLSLRFAGVQNNNEGTQVRNIRTSINEDHKYVSGRVSLSWEPTDALSVRFKFQNMEVDSVYPQPVAGSNGTPSYAQTVDGYVAQLALFESLGFAPPGTAAQMTFLNRPNYSDIPNGLKPEDRVALHFQTPKQNTTAEFHNLMIDYDMGSHALALRFSDSQSDAQGLIDRDYAGAYVYGYPQEVRTNTGIETFEMRLSNQDNDKLEYTVGVFSRDSQTYTTADLDRSFSITEVAPGLYKPLAGPGMAYKSPTNVCNAIKENPSAFYASMNVITCMGIPVDAKTEAYFANFKYNISENTFIQFGFREQEIDFYTQQNLYLPRTALLGVADGGGMTVPFVAADNTSQTADSTTGGFKVGHYLNEDLLLYVASESGYRRPSITITSTAMNPALLPFAEEESDMLEMGLKGTFMDGRLRLNAAYYDVTFDGFQTKWDNVIAREFTRNGPGGLTQVQGGIFNNNDASLSGIDIEYAYVVNADLTLGGSYSSTDSEYDDGSVRYTNDVSYTGMLAPTADVSGQRLNDDAESSMTFYLDHSVPAFFGGERYTRYNISWRDKEQALSILILRSKL